MGMGALQLGQRLSMGETPKKIVRQLDGGEFVLEDLASGRFTEHSVAELLDAWNSGLLRFAERAPGAKYDVEIKDLLDAYADAFRQTYTPAAWDRARMKLEFVMRLLKTPITEGILTPQIEEIWEDKAVWKRVKRPEKAPSWSTVATWLRRYRESDKDVRALIDRTQERGNRTPRYCPEVVEIVDDVIQTRYLTLERPTQADTLENIQGRIEQENRVRPKSEALPVPTKAMLKKRIAEVPAFDVFAARYGLPAARIKFRTCWDGVLALKPLARVAMDHYRMNLFVVDEESGLPLGRPWLTLLLDECTRCVVGYYLGFDEPSNINVARAIRHAIAPKDLTGEGIELVNDWDVWGVIDVIVVDNGLELHGETMEQGCAQFGMKIQYCPRKKPWYKGKIERFFRTVDQGLTSAIPGKTFGSIFERADYDSSKHAVVRLSTLREVVLKWIVDYYHQKEHRTLGMSPAQAWRESIEQVDRYLPSSSVLLDAAFSKSDVRRLTKDGIEFDSLFYQSEDLRRIRESLGSEIDVEVRVMDDDLGWVMVVVPDSKTIVRVGAVAQDYATGLTRWQHTICKRYKRLRFKRDGVHLELFEAKTQIRELIARDTNLVKRASRTRQKRFMGDEALAAQKSVTATPAPSAESPAAPLANAAGELPQPYVAPSLAAVPKYKPIVSAALASTPSKEISV